MVISSRLLSYQIWQKLQTVKALCIETKIVSSVAYTTSSKLTSEDTSILRDNKQTSFSNSELLKYRFIYPEFLPDPNPLYRNNVREKLERMDMMARRSKVPIPEFYVGSILAVTYSERHTPDKENKFVGICIKRTGCGLRAWFQLRNVVDAESVELVFDVYDPTIRKIECLRLEKRLDDELYYLRDAPLEYSTFPFDMEPEVLPEGTPVPLNDIVVPLNPPPYSQKWYLKDLKGLKNLEISEKRRKKAEAHAQPWAKYDLMKTYRETIPEEHQSEVFAELHTELRQLEIEKSMQKRKRTFVRPKKVV